MRVLQLEGGGSAGIDVDSFPGNLPEFTQRFATEQACRSYLSRLRWLHGFVSPQCGRRRAWPTARGTMFCAACKKQTSPTAGTVLHKSRAPLCSWFLAMWLACTQRTGLSAAGLQRTLGLGSYCTAWLLLQKLRPTMVRLGRERLEGTVAIDEAYLGEAESGVRGRQLAGRCLVAVELHGGAMGRIRLRHVADAPGSSLGEFVRDCVGPGSEGHTDGWRGYSSLQRDGHRRRAAVTRGDAESTQAESPPMSIW